MDQNTAIALYQIAEKRQQQSNPALVGSIDKCVIELGGLATKVLGRSPKLEEILPTIFDNGASLIGDHCLNPARFWILCERYALTLQGEKNRLFALQQAIAALRADNARLEVGQDYFINGIADSATCIVLAAQGYLLWDALQGQIRLCPLHWSDRTLQKYNQRKDSAR